MSSNGNSSSIFNSSPSKTNGREVLGTAGIGSADTVHDDKFMRDFVTSLTHDFDATDVFFCIIYACIFVLIAIYCCFIRPLRRLWKRQCAKPVDLDSLVRVEGYRLL